MAKVKVTHELKLKHVKARRMWEGECVCGRFDVYAPTKAAAEAQFASHSK